MPSDDNARSPNDGSGGADDKNTTSAGPTPAESMPAVPEIVVPGIVESEPEEPEPAKPQTEAQNQSTPAPEKATSTAGNTSTIFDDAISQAVPDIKLPNLKTAPGRTPLRNHAPSSGNQGDGIGSSPPEAGQNTTTTTKTPPPRAGYRAPPVRGPASSSSSPMSSHPGIFSSPIPDSGDDGDDRGRQLLTSPIEQRRLPSSQSPMHSRFPEREYTERQKGWVAVFKRLKSEHVVQRDGDLKTLEAKVIYNGSPLDFALIENELAEKAQNVAGKLFEPELELDDETRQIIISEVGLAMANLHRFIEAMLTQDEKFFLEVCDSLCDLIGFDVKSNRSSIAKVTDESGSRKFHKLRRDNLIKQTRLTLVNEFIERDRLRVEHFEDMKEKMQITINDRDRALGVQETTIIELQKERDRALEKCREIKNSVSSKVQERAEQWIRDNNLVEQKVEQVIRERGLVKPVPQPQESSRNRRRRHSSSDASSSVSEDMRPPKPTREEELAAQKEKDLEAAKQRLHEREMEEMEASKRKAALGLIRGIYSGTDTIKELSHQFARQVANDNSQPGSARMALTATPSSSASFRHPLRPNAAPSISSSSGAPRDSSRLGDELDGNYTENYRSEPPTAGGLTSPFQMDLSNPGNILSPGQTLPQPGLYIMPERYSGYAEHETFESTPSTVSVGMIARFVEQASQAPFRIIELIEKLVQMANTKEQSMQFNEAKGHLVMTASQTQVRKPTTLSKDQLEQTPRAAIEGFLIDAEPYLDTLTELLVVRTKELTEAVDVELLEISQAKPYQNQNPVYEDPKWLQKHPDRPCGDCVPVLDFQGQEHHDENTEADHDNKTDIDKAAEQKEQEPAASAHSTPSKAGRASNDDNSTRSVKFGVLPLHIKKRPQRLDLCNAMPRTPHPLSKASSIDGIRIDHYVCKNVAGERPEQPSATYFEASKSLWQQLLGLLYGLIRWLTWGQVVNLMAVWTFIPLLLSYWGAFLQRELESVMLKSSPRRRSLQLTRVPRIPGVAFSSLCLWLFLIWNAAMLLAIQEERRLWLAANPRTASYFRGLSTRSNPYFPWSPLEVDYALIEPAWYSLSMWLHDLYFRSGVKSKHLIMAMIQPVRGLV